MRNKWQNKNVVREFIYCPAWTLNPLAGVKYTKRDYNKAVEFSRSVAQKMVRDLCDNDPEKVRKLAEMHAELCEFNVAIVRAITPPFWGSNGDLPNWHGEREQVYSRHCPRVKCWHIWDSLAKQAERLERGVRDG